MENFLALLSLSAAAVAAAVSGLDETAGVHGRAVSMQRVLFGEQVGQPGAHPGDVWLRLQPHPALPPEPVRKRT